MNKTNKNYNRSVFEQEKIFWPNKKLKRSLKEVVQCFTAREKLCKRYNTSKSYFCNASIILKDLF